MGTKRAQTDRGVGTVLTAMVAMVLVMAMAVGVWILGWLMSHKRAADAADLASLAGAQRFVADPWADTWDACQRARATASSNGARVVECTLDGDQTSFVLKVTAESDLWPRVWVPGAPKTVRVTALAGSGNAAP